MTLMNSPVWWATQLYDLPLTNEDTESTIITMTNIRSVLTRARYYFEFFQVLTRFVLKRILSGRWYYYPHGTEEEVRSRGQVT